MNNALKEAHEKLSKIQDEIIEEQKITIHSLNMQVLYLKTKCHEITNYEQN